MALLPIQDSQRSRGQSSAFKRALNPGSGSPPSLEATSTKRSTSASPVGSGVPPATRPSSAWFSRSGRFCSFIALTNPPPNIAKGSELELLYSPFGPPQRLGHLSGGLLLRKAHHDHLPLLSRQPLHQIKQLRPLPDLSEGLGPPPRRRARKPPH